MDEFLDLNNFNIELNKFLKIYYLYSNNNSLLTFDSLISLF